MPTAKNTSKSARIAVALASILTVIDWSVLQKSLVKGYGSDAIRSYYILLLIMMVTSIIWAWKKPKSLMAQGLLIASLVLNVLTLAQSIWSSLGGDFASVLLPPVLLIFGLALTGLAFAIQAYYAATKGKAPGHLKYAREISWAALAMPIIFIVSARIIQDGIYVAVPYTVMITLGVKVGILLPTVGIVLGSLVWKSKVGKLAVVLSLLVLIHNGWWVMSLPQH